MQLPVKTDFPFYILKTLEKFELEDLIALKEVLDRAKNVNDGKVFDIFEYEKNEMDRSTGKSDN